MEMVDLHGAGATDETVAQVLGYPTIEINPEKRGKECSNCGSNEHTYEECTLPKMDELIEMFGPNICYDSTANAVQMKKKIIEDLYQPKVTDEEIPQE